MIDPTPTDTSSLPSAVALVGPTAAGKTELGLAVAQRFELPILCCDSVQIYRGLDIGSAKPTTAEQQRVPHRLIDLLDPDQSFSAGRYAELAHEQLSHRPGLFVGGTGFYLRGAAWTQSGDRDDIDLPRDHPVRATFEARWAADESASAGAIFRALNAVDQKTANAIDAANYNRVLRALWLCERHQEPISEVRRNDPPQPRIRLLVVVLDPGREQVYERIHHRTDLMIKAGWVEEVTRLRGAGYDRQHDSMRSLGYLQLLDFLDGRICLQEATEAIKLATRKYSRRQRTFFRGQRIGTQTIHISTPDEFPWDQTTAFLSGAED